MAKWWVNPPTGTPVSYPTKAAAERAKRSIKGAEVSQTKGPTRTLKVIKDMLRGGTGRGPKLPRDKFWR